MRIDDDSSERAQQAARAEERKAQDLQKKRRADEATAFDKALQSRGTEEKVGRSYAEGQQKRAQSAIRALVDARKDVSTEGKLEGRMEHAELEGLADDAHHAETTADQQKLQRGAAGRKDVDRKTGRMVEEGRGDDQHLSAGLSEHAQETLKEGEHHQQLRTRDASADQQRQQKRDDRGEPGGLRQSSGQNAGPKQVNERQKGKDQGQQQGGQQNPPGAFRLPPAALMAPPPVAVPKGEGQVSRLRQIAQEIAEKIVKQARVGVNKLGLPEFQLELKSDILKGLKVKVSGRHGRIRATFSSRDLQVLKQLRAEVDALKSALTARGLKVDALEIEEDRS